MRYESLSAHKFVLVYKNVVWIRLLVQCVPGRIVKCSIMVDTWGYLCCNAFRVSSGNPPMSSSNARFLWHRISKLVISLPKQMQLNALMSRFNVWTHLHYLRIRYNKAVNTNSKKQLSWSSRWDQQGEIICIRSAPRETFPRPASTAGTHVNWLINKSPANVFTPAKPASKSVSLAIPKVTLFLLY